MSAEIAFSEGLAALTRFYVGEGTLEASLLRVAELTVEALEPVDFAGLTMLIEDTRRTAVFTDRLSPEIDQAQYDSGEGPCLDAFETGRVVVIATMSDPGPYPAFRAAAFEHGINSTLSLPMIVDHGTVGAMNLYSRSRAGFSIGHRELAAAFAAQAAIVLANAQAYWDARDLSIGYREAMAYRAVIEQAKGIIMGAERCTAEDAFQVLRAASQRENVKLRDIAARIVTRTPTDGPDLVPGHLATAGAEGDEGGCPPG